MSAPSYEDFVRRWRLAGGSPSFAVPPALWRFLSGRLKPAMRTLETGSGLSTWLFDAVGCRHVALENSPRWRDLVLSRKLQTTEVVLAPLVGNPPRYDWDPPAGESWDLLLIDGPPKAHGGREGQIDLVRQLATPRTVLVFDDVNRPEERRLADRLQTLLQRKYVVHDGGDTVRYPQRRTFCVFDART